MTREEKIKYIIDTIEMLGLQNLEKLRAMKDRVCSEETEQKQAVRQDRTQTID